jgi:hypothetical protein
MNLNCLFALGGGTTFHRFKKNPFRPARPDRSSFLLSVKSARTSPIQPALEPRHTEQASCLPRSLRSAPPAVNRHPASGCPPRLRNWTEKVEVLVIKLLALGLALACIGCGVGFQHIAYVRQKNELCRQLRQKEVELSAVTQAYRSLESCAAAKAAEDFRRAEACPIVAKRAPQKVLPRG